jgi:uncharacterized surface protein with fasciclin (FAS1) repeats
VKIKRIFTYFTTAALVSASVVIAPAATAFTDSETGIGINTVSSVLNIDEFALDSNPADFDIFTLLALDVMGKMPNTRLWKIADGYFPMTAFLPTDEAFEKLVKSLTGISYQREEEIYLAVRSLRTETLNKILLYHLVFGDPLLAEDVIAASGTSLTTPRGDTFGVVYDGTSLTLRDQDTNRADPRVILSRVNLNAGNYQVIHPIDGVLTPELGADELEPPVVVTNTGGRLPDTDARLSLLPMTTGMVLVAMGGALLLARRRVY